MYKIGQKVIYSSIGVHEIIDIRDESVLGNLRTYYILRDIASSDGSLVYVPKSAEAEARLLRPLINPDEADKIIREYHEIPPAEWQENARLRIASYRELLESGDRYALASVILAIDKKSAERIASGKRPFLTDEHLRERAARLLISELSAVTGKPQDELKAALFTK